MSEWIKMSDRLPNEEVYLVYAENADPGKPFIYTAFWDAILKRWQGIPIIWANAITHWMPLPEKPKQ